MPAKRQKPRKPQRPRETVTKVIDGDTFETASRPAHSVRLANVDAPEKRQPGYQDAKAHLKELIEGKIVEVEPVAKDVYGRTVAKVRVDGKSVNAEMNKWLKAQEKLWKKK